MTRRLLNLVTALTLLLCVAAAALWARSYVESDRVRYIRARAGDRHYERVEVRLAANRGRATANYSRHLHQSGDPAQLMSRQRPEPGGTPPGTTWRWELRPPEWRGNPRNDTLLGRMGLAARAGRQRFDSDRVLVWRHDDPRAVDTDDHAYLATPLWLPCAAAALLPAARLGALVRRRRRTRLAVRRGTCPACGYDLNGNVSGVCPECGRRASPRD